MNIDKLEAGRDASRGGRMNIDKMEAGRELDALVAKMMGWRQEYARRTTGEMDLMWNEPEYLVPPGGDDAEKVPHYSTDIAAAWEVVEKLQEIIPARFRGDSYDWFYLDAPDRHDCKLWSAGWRHAVYYEADGASFSVDGETAPLAICRAALKAMRPEDRDNQKT